eukprot:4034891-Amphidinium_carterae.1
MVTPNIVGPEGPSQLPKVIYISWRAVATSGLHLLHEFASVCDDRGIPAVHGLCPGCGNASDQSYAKCIVRTAQNTSSVACNPRAKLDSALQPWHVRNVIHVESFSKTSSNTHNPDHYHFEPDDVSMSHARCMLESFVIQLESDSVLSTLMLLSAVIVLAVIGISHNCVQSVLRLVSRCQVKGIRLRQQHHRSMQSIHLRFH